MNHVPTRIDVDGAEAAAYLPVAKRFLGRLREAMPQGGARYYEFGSVRMHLWWTGVINKIRITAGGKLAFGSAPGPATGVVARYPGPDVPASLVRAEPVSMIGWSRDGRVGVHQADSATRHVYREGVFQLALSSPTGVQFRISDNGAVISMMDEFTPHPTTGDPGGFKIGRFAVWHPPVGVTSGFYEEIDPGVPDLSALAVNSFDSGRLAFYSTQPSLFNGGDVRLRARNAEVFSALNLYDAREMYCVVRLERIDSVTQFGSSLSRAWEVDVTPITAVFKYALVESGDTYVAGSWQTVDVDFGSTTTYTIVDQSWRFGGVGESTASTLIDGNETVGITAVFNAHASNFVEPWFRVSGAMEIARHESFGTPSQTVDDEYVLEDTGVSPFDPTITITRYFATTYAPLATQRILLSGVEFFSGGTTAELVGEEVAFLRHLGTGRRSLLLAPSFSSGYKWTQADGSIVSLGTSASLISLTGDRAYTKLDFAEATEFWKDGVLGHVSPVNTYGVIAPSFDNNSELLLTDDTDRRTASFDGTEVVLGDYIPNTIPGVATEFDPITLTPAYVQRKVAP